MNVWAMQSPATKGATGGRNALLAVGAVVGLFVSGAAWAQLGTAPMGTTGHASNRQAGSAERPTLAAPEAIPGAKRRDPVAPATRPAGDMQPTDALFDAINRGDIAAARDSLNRGADLSGVNVLGMTPMELSVDLGRNDISFLLLSMRGEDSGRGSRAVGRDLSAPVASAKAAPPTKPAAAVKTATSNNAAGGARPVATPRLFANDGGTPQPNAGFLGFDSRATSN